MDTRRISTWQTLLAWLLTGVYTGCAANHAAVQSQTLPLRRVVLYRNGVGYFERAGQAQSNQVRFRVRGDEIGDFLATMAVVERGGSSVRSASFPLSLETTSDKAHPSSDAEPVSPTTEPRKEASDRMVTVVLNLDGKEHALQVGYVAETPVWKPSYRLVLQRNGVAELQAWGIVHNLSGEDWSRVTLSLIAGAPLAFQATLGTPVTPARPTLTDTGEVVSVIPPSETTLAQAPPAPPAESQSKAAVAPEKEPTADDSESEEIARATRGGGGLSGGADRGLSGGADRRKISASKDKRKGVSAPAAMAMGSAMPSPMAPPPPAMIRQNPSSPRNLSSLAAVATEGSSTRYDIPNPVTIPDKSATMVMLLSKQVAGEGIFLFAPAPGVDDSVRHPFRVARFTNQTAGLLERGPIAVFEQGAFLGQGLVDALPQNATATVPFAIDRGVGVETATMHDQQGARLARIEAGELTLERDLRTKTTYLIRNGTNQVAKMLVKHSRRPATRLYQPPPGTEDNLGTMTALVPTRVAAKGKGEVFVDERTVSTQNAEWLSEGANEAVMMYLSDKRASKGVADLLRAAWAIRPVWLTLQNETIARKKEQEELARSTEETRKNLTSIEKNTVAGALRAQLTTRLAKASARLNEISKRLVELELQENEQRVRFFEIVRQIKLTEALPPPV